MATSDKVIKASSLKLAYDDLVKKIDEKEIEVDTTLTQAGEAADAKTVGDALAVSSEAIDTKITEPSTDGTSGQLLATNGNGGRYWRMPTASDVGAVAFNNSYITDANTFYSINGYAKTRISTTNLPSLCSGEDRWGVIFFIAENASNHTGTQMYFPINGTYKGRIFYRSMVGGTPSEWQIIPVEKFASYYYGNEFGTIPDNATGVVGIVTTKDGWVYVNGTISDNSFVISKNYGVRSRGRYGSSYPVSSEDSPLFAAGTYKYYLECLSNETGEKTTFGTSYYRYGQEGDTTGASANLNAWGTITLESDSYINFRFYANQTANVKIRLYIGHDTTPEEALNETAENIASLSEQIATLKGAMEILWTNPSPDDSFTGKTITLNNYSYEVIAVVFKKIKSVNEFTTFICNKGDGGAQAICMKSFSVEIRDFYYNGSGVTFGNSYKQTGIGSASEDNQYLVPFRILGMR